MIIDDFSNPKRKLTVSEASAANDYFTRRKSEEDRIAGVKAPAKNKKNPANTDYAKKRKQQDVTEAGHDHRRRAAASHDDEECSSCDGTGEGRHEGQSCGACGGSGVARGQYDHDDFEIPDKDDMYEGVAEGSLNEGQYEMMMRNGQVKKFIAKDDTDAKRIAAGHGAKSVIRMKGNVPGDKIGEQGVAEAGSFSYGKPPRKGSVADLAAKKRKEQERGQQPIEPKDQQVGVAKVTKGVAEGKEENIDQFISGNLPNFNGESNRVSADTAEYNFKNFLKEKGFDVDYINDQAYPVLVAICQGKMCAWYDFKNAYGYVSEQGKVVFSGTGANGGKYEIIHHGDDFMIRANGKHIDSYGSLKRAMGVLKNEVPGLKQGVAEGLMGDHFIKRGDPKAYLDKMRSIHKTLTKGGYKPGGYTSSRALSEPYQSAYYQHSTHPETHPNISVRRVGNQGHIHVGMEKSKPLNLPEQGAAEGLEGKVVFSGTGANGGKYKIIQTGPTDFMIHANGKHIDTYSSLQRAMSVLKNEVPGLTKGRAEGSEQNVTVYGNRQGYYAWTPTSGVLVITSGNDGPIKTQTYWGDVKGDEDPQIQRYISNFMKPVEFSELPSRAQRVISRHLLRKDVAEGLSKRDQKDVAAIKAAIERLESQLKQPNADKDAIQQSIAHERKRLALYKQAVAEGSLGTALPWPNVVNKVSGAMKAMGWKGTRKADGTFMFSTRGQETDDQYYIVIIDNAGEGFFTYALGTIEEGDPRIGEQESLPNTEASVSELMNAIRDGFGLSEQGVAEGLNENAEDLHIGDPVIITGNGIEFEGATGEIINFGQQHRFVVVDLYNHGRHSFHSSDVSFNEYAGSNDEEARMYDAGEFGDDDRDDMNESLMNKLQQALLKEGRVKELADDLKTLNDTEFMKKYSKAKAAIRKDMKKLHEAVSTLSPEQLAYNQLRAQIDSANFLRGDNTANTVVNTTPEVQASQANMNNKLAQMAAALKAKGIDAAAEYDAPEPGAAPAQPVDLNQKYNSKNKVQQPVAAAPVPPAQPGVAEARTSAAQRLSTAWDRQRAKSNASLARTPGSIPKKQEPKKADPVPKTVSEHRAKRQALMAQMLNGH